MGNPIKVVLLDDHPLMMEGLKNRLDQEPDIQVLQTFEDPCVFLEQIRECSPDVVVMDISMPHIDGFELARTLKARFGLSMKIILLSGYTYDEFYLQAYEIGVHAYLSKQATYVQIINAIKQSVQGYVLISERMFTAARQDQLTPTEREVLARIAEEKTNKEIAQELSISQRTVEHHLTSIHQKLGVKSRVGAVARGYELGILGRM